MIPKLSNKNNQTINPATEERQIEIRDGVNNLLEGPGSDAHVYGTQKLTINGAGLAQGLDESCKLIRLHFSSQNAVYLNINPDNEDADAGDFLLPSGAIIGPLPVVNANQVHLHGTAGDVIYMLVSK